MAPNQRLYRLSTNEYVQHAESESIPADVHAYSMRSGGELPPYIPLPQGPVVFRISRDGCWSRYARWDGVSALPPEVVDYVIGNGVLPPSQVNPNVLYPAAKTSPLQEGVDPFGDMDGVESPYFKRA